MDKIPLNEINEVLDAEGDVSIQEDLQNVIDLAEDAYDVFLSIRNRTLEQAAAVDDSVTEVDLDALIEVAALLAGVVEVAERLNNSSVTILKAYGNMIRDVAAAQNVSLNAVRDKGISLIYGNLGLTQ